MIKQPTLTILVGDTDTSEETYNYSGYSAPRDLHRRAAYSICESLFLIHQDVYHDLFVCS